MTDEPQDTYLHRIDPSLNMARYYAIAIQPTLFGGSSVVREWGRIGTRGRCKVELFDNIEQAAVIKDRLERSKRRRGYCEVASPKNGDIER